MSVFTIQVDGHEYSVWSTHGGDVIRVFAIDATGTEVIVADAERDTAVEQVFASYFINGGEDMESVEVPQELYWKNDSKALAEWLVAGF
jgi:hypothetical protein